MYWPIFKGQAVQEDSSNREDETGINLCCIISQKSIEPNIYTASVVDESNMNTEKW
jgi:hypothetical protein